MMLARAHILGIRIIATTIVVLTAAYSTTAAAQARPRQQSKGVSHEAFFRCKDRNGQTHYSDSMPAECTGLDTEVLNDKGMQLRVIEGDVTRQKRLLREVEERKLDKEREQRALRDRTLIETYLTVEDIERLRDQRLEMLNAQYRVTEQNISTLRDRQTRLQAQVARFRPYSDNANAPPLPEPLGAEMVNTVKGLRVYQESLAANRKEQQTLTDQFESDIKRFKELKGIR